RVRGLEAGADDFLSKPVCGIALMARVRSLSRLKRLTDELRMRASKPPDIGIMNLQRDAIADPGQGGRILVVDDHAASSERICALVAGEHSVDLDTDPAPCYERLKAITTCSLFRSASSSMTLCGCAARSARSSGPAISRSLRLLIPRTMHGF